MPSMKTEAERLQHYVLLVATVFAVLRVSPTQDLPNEACFVCEMPPLLRDGIVPSPLTLIFVPCEPCAAYGCKRQSDRNVIYFLNSKGSVINPEVGCWKPDAVNSRHSSHHSPSSSRMNVANMIRGCSRFPAMEWVR